MAGETGRHSPMIRPWYRSRLFWLGLPGLAFLLWAWWDSGKSYSGITWVRSRSLVSLYLSGGRLCLVATDETPVPTFSGPRLLFQRENEARSFDRTAVLFGGGLDRRERASRRYFGPGLYRLHWSIPYIPAGTPATAVVTITSRLSYWEWGAEWWLLVTVYWLIFSLVIVVWQRRKARLLKLQSAPPPCPPTEAQVP